MKFSIVTISYNQVDFLEQALRSVLDQQGIELEYIVVDPGSTDGSRDLIEKYRHRLQHVILEGDDGAADGLNKGFMRASGDILGFINSDDVLLPGALARVAQAFRAHETVDAVCGCGYFVDADGEKLRPIVPSRLTAWQYARGAVSVFQQGTFFRREVYERVGGFNVNNRTCWDGELFLDMALAGAKFMTLGDDLALFRLHDASITGTGRLNDRYARDVERLFTKVFRRELNAYDRLMGSLARLLKWLLQPEYVWRRVRRWQKTG